MIKDKLLLSGLIVMLIAPLVPLLMNYIGVGGLDYAWINDGDITSKEIVRYLGWILVAISDPSKEMMKSVVAKFKGKPAEA